MESFYIELYEGIPRFGPGSNESTRKAYSFFKDLPPRPMILDIGCGSGMQTIELAKISKGQIYAIDIFQEYLDVLKENAESEGKLDNIEIFRMSMESMTFDQEFFDVIWAESSIFVVGFEKGLIEWRRFIKKKGYLAVSELIWLRDDPPEDLKTFWDIEYPSIKNIKENRKIIEKAGYDLMGSFVLPEKDWWELLYTPLEKRLTILREEHKKNKDFLMFLESTQKEIDLYRKYSNYYGYAFYVMKNI